MQTGTSTNQPGNWVMRTAINTALLFLASVSLSSIAAEHANIPALSELKYQDARKLLLSNGWQPAQTIRANTQLEGQADDLRKLGYNEVFSCAGTGASPCLFFFRDAYKNILKIITLGELSEKDQAYPIVNSFELETTLPEESESDSIVVQQPPIPKLLAVPKAVASQTTSPIHTEEKEQKKYYSNPEDCKSVRAAPYFMVMGNGIDESSSLFNALVKLIQNGNYYIEGYSVQGGHCYADITVDGVYNGNSYNRKLHSLLSGSM